MYSTTSIITWVIASQASQPNLQLEEQHKKNIDVGSLDPRFKVFGALDIMYHRIITNILIFYLRKFTN